MPTGFRKKYLFLLMLFSLPAYVAAGSVDTGKVEQHRLQWNNELRTTLELPHYNLDQRLSATAQERSEKAAKEDNIDHKRKATDGYYNYAGIENRFLQRGVKFKNVNRATFSESLGYGYFSCKKDDCTEELIKAVKSTRNMYMRERPSFGLHYKALVHPYFQTMGLGVSVDAQAKRYYLTIHYASQVIGANPTLRTVASSVSPSTKGTKRFTLVPLAPR